MKLRISIIFLVLGLLGVVVFNQYVGNTEPTLKDVGSEIGLIIPSGKEFTIQKDLVRQGDRLFRSLEGKSDTKLLKLEVITGLSVEEADRTIVERVTMIQSLFNNIPSPYPGMVTNKVSLSEKLLPRKRMVSVGGEELPLYILVSSERYTYGAMSEEMVAYMGGLFFLYDNSRHTLYRLDYFVPRSEFVEEEMVDFFNEIQLVSGVTYASGNYSGRKDVQSTVEVQPSIGQISSTLKFKGYNVILIGFEPLGANHVSSYGYTRKTTPNLDDFAEKSFLFENAISPSSWTLPVFMSWFTSLYPSQHKVVNKYSTYTEEEEVLANLSELSPGVVTLTQVFRENGYRTAGFTGGASLAGDFGFKLGFETYFDQQRMGGFDLTMPKAIKWLQENKGEQFFLFVQGYDMHGTFPLNREHLNMFLDGQPYNGTLTGDKDEYWQIRNESLEKEELVIESEDLRLLKAVYDAKIYAADRRFGDFIKRLEDFGLLEKTIIIVSSGSGNEYMEHGRVDHGFSLYEELTRVPFLIRFPGHHGRVSQLVRTIDMMPTIVDLLDLQVTDQLALQMQGVSLVPSLTGIDQKLMGISETDYLQHTYKRAIKTNDGWKLIMSLDTEERELYNLNEDPGEKRNLIKDNGRKAYELEQKLFEHLRHSYGEKFHNVTSVTMHPLSQ